MTNQTNHTKRNVLIGIGLAAAAGYVAGMLLAPKSGRELRADIKREAVKAEKKVVETTKKLEKTATRDVQNLLVRADEISEAVRKLADSLKK